MKTLRAIRIRAGMKQAQLANYLGVSRTLLSMAECGLRQLPVSSLLKLQRLIDLLPPNPPVQPPMSVEQRQATRTSYENRLRVCQKELMRWQRQLRSMQRMYKTALDLYANSLAHLNRSDSDHTYWQARLRESIRGMERNGEGPQGLVEMRIAAFEAEVKKAKELLGRLGNEE